jgi:hypothetical protein
MENVKEICKFDVNWQGNSKVPRETLDDSQRILTTKVHYQNSTLVVSSMNRGQLNV